MFIFIRGLPGSGKTTISNKLAEQLHWDVIHVDHYKTEFISQNQDAYITKEFIPYSHKKTLEKLSDIKNNVIIEELFWNNDFIQALLSFCKKNNIQYQWFKLIRDKKTLLSIKRKIRNTFKDFETMEKQIDDIKIKDEIIINNQNTDETIKQILTFIDKVTETKNGN